MSYRNIEKEILGNTETTADSLGSGLPISASNSKCSLHVKRRTQLSARPIDAEALLHWAVVDQRVIDEMERDDDRLEGWLEGKGGTLAAAARIGRLGCIVDAPGAGTPMGGAAHPDAETVYNILIGLERNAAGSLIAHAMTGLRPDWKPGAVFRVSPEIWSTGRYAGKVVVETLAKDKHGNVIEAVCPIGYHDNPRDVVRARAEYSAWWRALFGFAELARRHGLRDYLVIGPAAPIRPWGDVDEALQAKLLRQMDALAQAIARATAAGKKRALANWTPPVETAADRRARRTQDRVSARRHGERGGVRAYSQKAP